MYGMTKEDLFSKKKKKDERGSIDMDYTLAGYFFNRNITHSIFQ